MQRPDLILSTPLVTLAAGGPLAWAIGLTIAGALAYKILEQPKPQPRRSAWVPQLPPPQHRGWLPPRDTWQ